MHIVLQIDGRVDSDFWKGGGVQLQFYVPSDFFIIIIYAKNKVCVFSADERELENLSEKIVSV